MKKLPLAILICSILITVVVLVLRPEEIASEEIEIQTEDQLFVLGVGDVEYTIFKMDFESKELREVLSLSKKNYWRFIDGATHDCLYLSCQKEYQGHYIEIYSLTGDGLVLLLEVNISDNALIKGYVQGKVYFRDGYYDVENEEYHENEEDYYYLSVNPNGDLLTYREPWIGIEKADGTVQTCVQGASDALWNADGSGFIYFSYEDITNYYVYYYDLDTQKSIQYPKLGEHANVFGEFYDIYDIALSTEGNYLAYYSYNPGKGWIKKDTLDTNLIITNLSTGESLIFDDNEYNYGFELSLRWVNTNE